MDLGQELEDDAVARHGVEHPGQGKHGAEQTGTKRKHSADVHDPLDGWPADLIVHVWERGLWVLRNEKKRIQAHYDLRIYKTYVKKKHRYNLFSKQNNTIDPIKKRKRLQKPWA